MTSAFPLPYEMGMIACAASEVSGKTMTNPYPEGTLVAKLWDEGYEAEAKKIREED